MIEQHESFKSIHGTCDLNAVLNHSLDRWEEGNITTALDVAPTDTFGMVGFFRPILNVVKKKTDNIYIFEQYAEKESGLYSDRYAHIFAEMQCDCSDCYRHYKLHNRRGVPALYECKGSLPGRSFMPDVY